MLQVQVPLHIGVVRGLVAFLIQLLPVDGLEERMIHDLPGVFFARAKPHVLVFLEKTFQEVPGIQRDVWSEFERLVEDVVVHFGHISGIERREGVEHFIGDYAQAPPVDGPPVVLFPQHFRGQVLGCATECGCSLAKLDVLLAQAEISEDDVSVGAQQDVFRLEVSIDDVHAVEIRQC